MRKPLTLPQATVGIDLPWRSCADRTVTVPAASIHSKPVQRGEGLAPDGDVSTGHVDVVFHHRQGLMPQVLLEKEHVPSI